MSYPDVREEADQILSRYFIACMWASAGTPIDHATGFVERAIAAHQPRLTSIDANYLRALWSDAIRDAYRK